jgi:hypothetical protein
VVVLVSDLRQESALGHFECAMLPSVSSWTTRTKTMFSPLQGTTVLVAFASPLEPVSGLRCALTNERYEQVVTLWNSALTARGTTVKIYPDAIPDSLESFNGGAR